MSGQAWPFLIARTRNSGHRVVVEPDFMAADGTGYLLKQVAIEEDSPPGTATLRALREGPRAGSLTVLVRNYLPTEREFGLGDAEYILDRHGRPIQFTEGLVFRDAPDAVARTGLTARDLSRAHQAVVPAFGEFWEREEEFKTRSSQPFQTVGEDNPRDPVELRAVATKSDGRAPERMREPAREPARRPQSAASNKLVAAAAVALVVGVTALISLLVVGGGSEPEAKIDSPRGQSAVDASVTVGGTSTGVAGSSHQIWVVVRPEGGGGFYPQNPPATLGADGRWSARTVRVGQSNETGRLFTIYAVIATEAASDEFEKYFKEHGAELPGLPRLPDGASQAHSITVTRK